MVTAKFLKRFVKQFSDSLPQPLKMLRGEFEKQFYRGLKMAFEKLDLVSREEFDTQSEVLIRTRQKLQKLEERLKLLEERVSKEMETVTDIQGTDGKL